MDPNLYYFNNFLLGNVNFIDKLSYDDSVFTLYIYLF